MSRYVSRCYKCTYTYTDSYTIQHSYTLLHFFCTAEFFSIIHYVYAKVTLCKQMLHCTYTYTDMVTQYSILTLYYMGDIYFIQRRCFYHSLCLCKGRLMSHYVSRCYIAHTHTQTVTAFLHFTTWATFLLYSGDVPIIHFVYVQLDLCHDMQVNAYKQTDSIFYK